MDQPQPYWTDQRVETIVGNLLRTGVILSAAVILFGAILYLAQHRTETSGHEKFVGEPARLRHLTSIVADVATLDGAAVIQFGLLLLMATPVARVALCLGVFAVQRDRLYVVITLVVLAVLLFSLIVI